MRLLNPHPTALPTWILFDFGSFSTRDPEIEVFSRQGIKRRNLNGLRRIHQNGVVMRSGEYWPSETASKPPGAGAGAQPNPHNPRKQREIPTVARRGETFL